MGPAQPRLVERVGDFTSSSDIGRSPGNALRTDLPCEDVLSGVWERINAFGGGDCHPLL